MNKIVLLKISLDAINQTKWGPTCCRSNTRGCTQVICTFWSTSSMLPLIRPTDRAFITRSSTCNTEDHHFILMSTKRWTECKDRLKMCSVQALKKQVENQIKSRNRWCSSRFKRFYWWTDLINGDFGALSDLSEGELSVVCRTSESHLEGKETFNIKWLIILFF